ncbi:N-acyl-D-amino-acid deacylase family protein [Rhodohalobacter sp. 8-1]|uniref:N-acyl-D-amino-acid deacylase family protein n=1 Tax=Rhodohalobacter sp. 8-1 TaxID=3131972 RepID=UPI0030EB6A20
MINKHILPFLLLMFLWLCSCSAGTDNSQYDLLITNASIVDGSGADAFEGSILIHNGLIEEVGSVDTTNRSFSQILNAEGRVVSPGFIDTHSHGNPLETPRFNNFLSMGVTTISLGQDGSSPGTGDVSAWMDRIDSVGTGPNVVHFIGHNSVRRFVNAPREENLDSTRIAEMQELVAAAMADGSFGLTTGLEYDHGSFAGLQELIALAEPVAEAGGVVMSHMRNEDEDAIAESVAELVNQGLASGANVHASHLKIVYGNDPQQAEDVLSIMQDARVNEGLRITADLYPYTASYTGIGIVFPDWALPPNNYEQVVENRRVELEEYLNYRIGLRNGPEATLFGTEPYAGKTLEEVADSLGKSFADVLIDDIGPNGASAAYFVMDEEVMARFLINPFVMVSSDGSPTMRHPRGYGSFAKIIRRFVNEEPLLTLEQAIYKMSGLPAETLGLANRNAVDTPRGLIREGFSADILIFDPANVRDMATFENPHTYAEGFDWVFVNGVPVIEDGERNSETPAGVIRKRVDL